MQCPLHKMRLANRNPLAILYSCLLFGNILAPVPYYYFVAYFLIHGGLQGNRAEAPGPSSSYDPLMAFVKIFPWLAVCTLILLPTWISQSRVEQMLAKELERYFRPFLFILVILAMAMQWGINLVTADVPFLKPVEYWFNLIMRSGIATALVFVVISFTPPSRLERSLASRFGRENKWNTIYRAIGYLTLMALFAFISSEVYAYYFLPRPTWYH